MHKKYEPYQKVNAEYWKLKKAEETKGKGGILASLHFKEQGQTFAQKLKRVLKADCSTML